MKLLVVEARFYDDINDVYMDGVKSRLEEKNIDYDLITISGALEIPSVIKFAEESTKYDYDGYIAIGCVVRGETTHYDYVCEESARAIMDLNLAGVLTVNGILTVENKKQAIARASKDEKNKGGFVVDACVDLIEIKNKFKS